MTLYLYLVLRKLQAGWHRLRRALRGDTIEQFDLQVETPIRTFYEGPVFDPLQIKAGLRPIEGIPGCGLWPAAARIAAEKICGRQLLFYLQPDQCFFGDALQIVDLPDEKPVDKRFPPFGWSGPSLTGGYALTSTPLSGTISIQFEPVERDGFVNFTLHHKQGLQGPDSTLSSPAGYCLPTTGNQVHDTHMRSHGKLELKTGRLYNFHYNVQFDNSAIDQLSATNPGLSAPPLLFPGLPYAGHAFGYLRVTSSVQGFGLSIYAGMFLPLGPDVAGSPIRMPGMHKSGLFDKPFPARNSSLHPFISIEATTFPMEPQLSKISEPLLAKFNQLQNTRLTLLSIPHYNCFGDIFTLNNPVFQSVAHGQTPALGKLDIQFGSLVNQVIPYTVTLRAWSDTFATRLAKVLRFLPPGTQAGWVGLNGILDFTSIKHIQRNLSIQGDAQKLSIGTVHLGRNQGNHSLIIRGYFFLDVLARLMVLEPRTPTDSFAFVSRAVFQMTADGNLIYTTKGEVHIPYPTGYLFPLPNRKGGALIGPDSFLRPFLTLCAVEECAFHPNRLDAFALASKTILRGLCQTVAIHCKLDREAMLKWTITIDEQHYIGYSTNMIQQASHIMDFDKVGFVEVNLTGNPATTVVLFLHENVNKTFFTAFSTNEALGFWAEMTDQE
ncbi:hypothetical protein [Spirosoma gilvum]